MIKLISVDELRPGMFIHRLDVWWPKDKGASGQTLIGDPRQIARIQARGIRHLWIDLDKTLPLSASLPPQQNSHPESLFISELSSAQRILQEGKPEVRAMFNEARRGHRLNLSWALPLVDGIAGSVHRHPSGLLSVALVAQPGKASLLCPGAPGEKSNLSGLSWAAVTAAIPSSARKRRACGVISILTRSGCWKAYKLSAGEIYQD